MDVFNWVFLGYQNLLTPILFQCYLKDGVDLLRAYLCLRKMKPILKKRGKSLHSSPKMTSYFGVGSEMLPLKG